ncbi:MAG TPA: ATP-grasp domain-containing protein [Vicinamibacterales bacterium]|nr:ATP-grasp domain-containing protein [Vicinamibacterales bacterium]
MTECCIPAGHPPAAVEIARNKLLTRERLRDTDLLVPWFFPTSFSADPAALAGMVAFPCMIKPVIPTGGRGVTRVDDGPSFVRVFQELRGLLASVEFSSEADEDRSTALVEGYVDGLEFVLAGTMRHGTFNASSLYDVEGALPPAVSQAPDDMRKDIEQAVSRATAAMGLRDGTVQVQCMVTDRGVYVLDVSLERWRRAPV